MDLIEKLVNDFGYQLIMLGRDENFNESEFVECFEHAGSSPGCR